MGVGACGMANVVPWGQVPHSRWSKPDRKLVISPAVAKHRRHPDTWTRAFVTCKDKFGAHPDVLVNNAGVAHHAAFVDVSGEEWERVYDVNLRAPLHGELGGASAVDHPLVRLLTPQACRCSFGLVWRRNAKAPS